MNKAIQTSKKRNKVGSAFADIYENKDEFLILLDLPGVLKNNVEVQYHEGDLTIKAVREEDLSKNVLASEYQPHDFQRLFSIPYGIDPQKIQADLQAGVLTVRLPKLDALKPRKIDVRSS